MRVRPTLAIERFRLTDPASPKGATFGAFMAAPYGTRLRILACDGNETGWDHVSVSTATRCPTWEEMAWVKEQFWGDDECVIQLHPPKRNYVNVHPYCLHLWKQASSEFPMPPLECV